MDDVRDKVFEYLQDEFEGLCDQYRLLDEDSVLRDQLDLMAKQTAHISVMLRSILGVEKEKKGNEN